MDNIKVLMVDDESRMRKLVSDFLTRKGYIVMAGMYAGRLERILKCLLLCLQLRAMNQAN